MAYLIVAVLSDSFILHTCRPPCRLETNKLRNVARFFAHLLYSDAVPWTCLESIRLSEDATTSSSRIFIKILVLVGGLHCCIRLYTRDDIDYDVYLPRREPAAESFVVRPCMASLLYFFT